MSIQELLRPLGIDNAHKFHIRAGLNRQTAWLIWNEKIAISAKSTKQIHKNLDIPVELILAASNKDDGKAT